MARLTREESQAQTRAKLLAAAARLFSRDGYQSTSIDRIAEEAGFSKGAFYSNFSGKEQIYLEVLETYGEANLQRLLARLTPGLSAGEVLDLTAGWAAETARNGNWAQLVLEYARAVRGEKHSPERQEALFREHWRLLGERLTALLNLSGLSPQSLGGLVFELTYAPAMSFMTSPDAGDLVRLALDGIIARHALAR